MNGLTLRIKLYSSKKIKSTQEFCKKQVKLLKKLQYPVELQDVESDEIWPSLGLKSVPALVFFINDVPVGNIIKYFDIDLVEKRIEKLINYSDKELKKKYYGELNYYIAESSGSHRYERWNEEALKLESTENGWTSPSIKNYPQEFVIVNFNREVAVDKLLLRPRVRSDGTDSFKSFPKKISIWRISDDGMTEEQLHLEEVVLDSLHDYFKIILSEEVVCRKLKVKIDQSMDIDGKAFPSIINLKFLGYKVNPQERESGYFIKRGKSFNLFNKNFFTNFGLFYNDNISIELFNLIKDQALPTCHIYFYKVLVVLEGSVKLIINKETEVITQKEDLIIIEPNNNFKAIGVEKENKILVIFNSKMVKSIWESR